MENQANHIDIMPKELVRGRTFLGVIDEIVLQQRNWKSGDSPYTGKSDRYIMGYPLPPFQRPIKWSDEQCVKLIDNIWRRASIGSFMLNVVDDRSNHPFDGWLIDGQQRLYAIERYMNNEFSTKDIKGREVFWKNLPIISQRRFRNTSFPSVHINSTSKEELVEIYNTLNFGGVPHTEEDRAVI
ncbi:MAG: DUF262 domain-containing protein [Methylophilus sp.]|uniref:DUF262 domain-containing protein n=1 Tax=Methylophilus sp. TaxID=29541 RepID=UPI003F9F4DF0